MLALARRVCALLLASGMCALVYQTVWMREFRLVFGASTAASAAVLAIFIGGLGTGSLLIGPRADRHPRPLMLYAWLEGTIGVSVALTPLLLDLVRRLYALAGGTPSLGVPVGTALRLLLSALVLALPTVLMGGTLPAAARAVMTEGDARRRSLALLYGANTFGAVSGAFLAGFFMLEVFGSRRTLWLACLVNLLVAVVARRLARSAPASLPSCSEGPGEATAREATEQPPLAPARFVMAAAAIVGFAFFLMELVWYRMLGPILGGTVFTFTLILAVALLGIGVGGAIYGLARRERPPTLVGFSVTCLLEAAAMALPFALGDRLAVLTALLRPLGSVALFWGQVATWLFVAALVILPAAIVSGYQFPLLIALLGRGRERVGRHVGIAYAWNTLGAILGSLAGGFGLLPLLTAPGVWRLVVALLLATSIAALLAGLASMAGRRAPRFTAYAFACAAIVALITSQGPTAFWRHSGIGAGRGPSALGSPNGLRAWEEFYRRSIVWEAEGVESSVALQAYGSSLAFVVNGKIDGNARGDASTTVMGGLVGALLHPEPRRAMVIGLGVGSTAGWLGAVPTMERVDVVELEPLIMRVARDCTPVNHDVLDNPKVHVAIGDAREVLTVRGGTYDLIFSEPSNPYRAGVASLFTREYYRAIAARLAPDGIFMQWVQAYEVDLSTLRSIYAALAAAFPEVETWQVRRDDLLLVASRRPLDYDVPRLRARIAQEPYRTALRVAWEAEDLEGFLGWFVARPSFAGMLARQGRARVNSDDQNHVEFGAGRTVGNERLFVVGDLRLAALERREDLPVVRGGAVDWERVGDARARHLATTLAAPAQRPWSERQGMLVAALLANSAGDARGFVAAWDRLRREPNGPYERRLLATSLGQLGDERALAIIQRIRAEDATTAAILEAQLRLRQGRGEGVDLICDALTRLRTDPWPAPTLPGLAIRLAVRAAQSFPNETPRVVTALSRPLALLAENDSRLEALAEVMTATRYMDGCAAVVDEAGRHGFWTQSWLSFRDECLTAQGDARASDARADLSEFRRREPERLVDR